MEKNKNRETVKIPHRRGVSEKKMYVFSPPLTNDGNIVMPRRPWGSIYNESVEKKNRKNIQMPRRKTTIISNIDTP